MQVLLNALKEYLCYTLNGVVLIAIMYWRAWDYSNSVSQMWAIKVTAHEFTLAYWFSMITNIYKEFYVLHDMLTCNPVTQKSLLI